MTVSESAPIPVTSVLPVGDGHLTVWPCGLDRPGTASVNYVRGGVSPNAAVTTGPCLFLLLEAEHLGVEALRLHIVPAGERRMVDAVRANSHHARSAGIRHAGLNARHRRMAGRPA